MKGLDSSAILSLLHGQAAVTKAVRAWAGEEIATSEMCLIELTAIALRQPPKVRAARMQALERLRRRVTVLPVDHRTQTALASHPEAGATQGALASSIVLATLEAAGCDEVLTTERARLSRGRWRLKVRVIK